MKSSVTLLTLTLGICLIGNAPGTAVSQVTMQTTDTSDQTVDACKQGKGSKEECDWQKQCIEAGRPNGRTGKTGKELASACAVEYRESGARGDRTSSYPEFHYDAKSFWSNSGEHRSGETGAKLSCSLQSAEVKAKGLRGCAQFSIEFREMDEAAKKDWYGLKSLTGRAASRFVDDSAPASSQPQNVQRRP